MTAAQPSQAPVPRRFSPHRFFATHRPAGYSVYAPLPVECWIVHRNSAWNNYVLSRGEERTLRALMRLVPEPDLKEEGRPWVTGPAGYGRLGRMTHTCRDGSTARRNIKSLIAKHVIVAWDVARNEPAPKHSGRRGGRRETRYLIRRYGEVRTRIETDGKIGKEPDPTNDGALHFFKLGRGARLLTPEELADWDAPGYMQQKLAVKQARQERDDERRHSGPQLVRDENVQEGSTTAQTNEEPADYVFSFFRQVSRTLNDRDILGMYADVVKLAGPVVSERDLGDILRETLEAGGNKKGFAYLAKTVREKAKGLGEAKRRDAARPQVHRNYQEPAAMFDAAGNVIRHDELEDYDGEDSA